MPSFSAPKMPEFKAPDISVPEFKAPDIEIPEIKAPDISIPEIKAPDLSGFEMPSLPSAEPEDPRKAPRILCR